MPRCCCGKYDDMDEPLIHNQTMHEILGVEGAFCGPVINHVLRDTERERDVLREAMEFIASQGGMKGNWAVERARLALRDAMMVGHHRVGQRKGVVRPQGRLLKRRLWLHKMGGQAMKLEDIKQAWNAQADEHNQWGSLSGEEMVEFALELMDKRRCASCDNYGDEYGESSYFPILKKDTRISDGCIHWEQSE